MRVQTTHRTGRSDRGRVLLLKVSGTTDVGSNKCAQTVKRQTAQQSLLCASGEQATAAVIAFTEGGTRVHAVPFATPLSTHLYICVQPGDWQLPRQQAHLSLQSEMALTGCTPLKPGGSCCGADSRASRAALKVAANSSALACGVCTHKQTAVLRHNTSWASESMGVQLAAKKFSCLGLRGVCTHRHTQADCCVAPQHQLGERR